MPQHFSFPQCFDPYLRFAISTDFVHFELFDEKKSRLFFLVEFKEVGLGDQFKTEMGQAGFDVVFGPADDKTRYATMHTDKAAAVAAVPDSEAFRIWERYVSRVELSLPLKPSSQVSGPRIERWKGRMRNSKKLLIGVLDHGCPFAASHFLATTSSAVSTRVLAIWDQNEDRVPIPVNDSASSPCLFGEVPSDFNYGLEFQRDSEPGSAPLRQMGLDEWIRLHSTPTGSIDEDGCYADAEFTEPTTLMRQTRMRRRQSHGAHVMDLFAGRVPPSSRVGPSMPGQDRRDPPSWTVDTRLASRADVVFVQFPEAGIRDHTGVWLRAYVVQGIHYILSWADPNRTERVVINLSYGPTTGPHDGTAVLEADLAALIAEFDGIARRPRLEIVLAAGNAYLSEGHVVFERARQQQPDHVEWTWRLLPDNTVLCFAEVWMTTADAGSVTVTLTSPTGAPMTVAPPVAWGINTVWRLEVGSTIADPLVVSPQKHGDYRISVANVPVSAQVHAYVARTDPNMDVRTGAKRSYFVDAQWEQTRSAAARHRRNNGEFDKSGSLVRRDGTLNGLATGQVARVHVAGGYMLANRRGSPYSSAGPARIAPPGRLGPDSVLPCDESYALGGIRAGGNRSGGVFRLIGTSAAAPQLARHVANGAIPPATNVPTNPAGRRKRGAGNIEPP